MKKKLKRWTICKRRQEKKTVKESYMKSSYKMKKEEVDEHMNALVAGQDDLSEEFKTKLLPFLNQQ